MTIQQANQYFAALPDGFADPAQLGALLPASVQQVQFVGVAGTAGKTAVARLLAAILRAQGICAGVYHAGCEPLAARIRVDGKPVEFYIRQGKPWAVRIGVRMYQVCTRP